MSIMNHQAVVQDNNRLKYKARHIEGTYASTYARTFNLFRDFALNSTQKTQVWNWAPVDSGNVLPTVHHPTAQLNHTHCFIYELACYKIKLPFVSCFNVSHYI